MQATTRSVLYAGYYYPLCALCRCKLLPDASYYPLYDLWQATTRSVLYADASYYPMQATTRSMIYGRLLPRSVLYADAKLLPDASYYPLYDLWQATTRSVLCAGYYPLHDLCRLIPAL